MREEESQIKDMLSNKNIDGLVHNRFHEVTKDQHIAQIYKKRTIFSKSNNEKRTRTKPPKTFSKIRVFLINKQLSKDLPIISCEFSFKNTSILFLSDLPQTGTIIASNYYRDN